MRGKNVRTDGADRGALRGSATRATLCRPGAPDGPGGAVTTTARGAASAIWTDAVESRRNAPENGVAMSASMRTTRSTTAIRTRRRTAAILAKFSPGVKRSQGVEGIQWLTEGSVMVGDVPSGRVST
jgi:hypothetical protein